MILSLQLLRFDPIKAYLVVPLLSVLSLMILPLSMYWSCEKQAEWLYTMTRSLDQADSLLVRGKDGNIEIVKLDNQTENVKNLIGSDDPFIVSLNTLSLSSLKSL